MKSLKPLAIALASVSLVAAPGVLADEGAKVLMPGVSPVVAGPLGIAKAASAQTLGSRARATSTATVFGGFELREVTNVYIMVRGNSLGTLGITQDYLDAPRVRLYNAAGQDLITDGSGRAGFNQCLAANTTTDKPVIDYYTLVRGEPPNSRDACLAAQFQPGVYTFSVTPSIPGVTTTTIASDIPAGETLFEVTLNP